MAATEGHANVALRCLGFWCHEYENMPRLLVTSLDLWNSHTGCGLDYHRIWTSDNCTTAAGIQGFFSRAGNAAHEAKHPLRCMPVFKTLGTRCCADLFKVNYRHIMSNMYNTGENTTYDEVINNE